jgi:hypothetical protein
MGINQVPAPSLNGSMQEQRFTSSGTWNAPSGVTRVWVSLVGGGGSGSKLENQNISMPGNPGGVLHEQATVVAGTAYTITIGAGGAGLAAGGTAAGNNGSNTTALSLTGAGGLGGVVQDAPGGSGYLNWKFAHGSNLQGSGVLGNGAAAAANTGIGGMSSTYGGASGAGGSGLVILKWIS